ncbi:phenylacetyl-CoA ligase [Hyaloscypha sp. PMI_1271]|nr:phenylacetyl-CoA ligase [Hyaloscypha sp. PMI_1271]
MIFTPPAALTPKLPEIPDPPLYSMSAMDRVQCLARALAQGMGWEVNRGSEFDKAVCVFALNTPRKAISTITPLLPIGLAAAVKAGIPSTKIYICEMTGHRRTPEEFKSLTQLIRDGQKLPELEAARWSKGQAAHQAVFLFYSSGTSGLPKGVTISHRNVIANTIQVCMSEREPRLKLVPNYAQAVLALLPFSHIYGLVIIAHCSTFRGDAAIVLPKFDLQNYLKSISRFRINSLLVVPPIILTMVKNKKLMDTFNLSSVRYIFSGAAPVGQETARELAKQYPTWTIRQGYGLTETCSGCILAGVGVKVINAEGNEVTGYDQPGELFVKSPSVVMGYLNNDKANGKTLLNLPEGGFMRTGNDVIIRKSPKGNEHVWISDRLKELIKVNGLQVAPAELKACILDHPAVADMISIPDEKFGEVPKAFVVKLLKSKHQWLRGGVEFVEVISKSLSGKILRRVLKEQEKAERVRNGAKL